MTTIVTRAGKGSPLTHTEVDTNFTNLNTNKLETAAIPLGTLAAPSISFVGDANTGAYSPGADTLAFVTAGSNRLHITSGGLVGLGTASPSKKLEVAGDIVMTGLDGFAINYAANAGSCFLSRSGVLTSNVQFGGTTSNIDIGSGGGFRITPGTSQCVFSSFPDTANVGQAITLQERMRIDTSGRLLVGTSTATGANLLQVNSDALVNGLTVGRGASAISSNTAVGGSALASNTTGSSNTAIGANALVSNTTGTENTAVGFQSLYSKTTSSFNTAIGRDALYSTTTGSSNTAIGNAAGLAITTGAGNISIGALTSAGASSPVSAITAENNRISMGSTAVTHAYIQVAWTVVSDARDKINFSPVPHGLDFVNALKPTAFQFKLDRESDQANGPVRYGFKAQDILELEGENSIIIDSVNPDKLYYNGESLIPVLVNAIKELSAKNTALEARLTAAGID